MAPATAADAAAWWRTVLKQAEGGDFFGRIILSFIAENEVPIELTGANVIREYRIEELNSVDD
jgi:hypothetical protein